MLRWLLGLVGILAAVIASGPLFNSLGDFAAVLILGALTLSLSWVADRD